MYQDRNHRLKPDWGYFKWGHYLCLNAQTYNLVYVHLIFTLKQVSQAKIQNKQACMNVCMNYKITDAENASKETAWKTKIC